MSGLGGHIVVLIAAAMLSGGAAMAQDLTAGKTPAQLFSGGCSACHKSPQGLAKSTDARSISSFLRQHYTSSPEMAQALAGFLVAAGPGSGPRERVQTAVPARAPAATSAGRDTAIARPRASVPGADDGRTEPTRPTRAQSAARSPSSRDEARPVPPADIPKVPARPSPSPEPVVDPGSAPGRSASLPADAAQPGVPAKPAEPPRNFDDAKPGLVDAEKSNERPAETTSSAPPPAPPRAEAQPPRPPRGLRRAPAAADRAQTN